MSRANPVMAPLRQWLEACSGMHAVSRNTICIGIVVLDHMRTRCPVTRADVLSTRGEIKHARSGLAAVLERYGLPRRYLKEVTTRAGHQDGQRLFEVLGWGAALATMEPATREECLNQGIELLVEQAQQWLNRQHLKVRCDQQLSPDAWIGAILNDARDRSGGKVEQHLVGAKLQTRHPDTDIPNFAGHAADVQTGRAGDFVLGTTVYHVTASPGSDVLHKCARNLESNLRPVLLVPRHSAEKARHLAEDQRIDKRVMILAIEDFIGVNIIEMSTGEQQRFLETLKRIVEEYNRRLQVVESDMSLKIEVQ